MGPAPSARRFDERYSSLLEAAENAGNVVDRAGTVAESDGDAKSTDTGVLSCPGTTD